MNNNNNNNINNNNNNNIIISSVRGRDLPPFTMVTFVLSAEPLFSVQSHCFSAEPLFAGIVFRIYVIFGKSLI